MSSSASDSEHRLGRRLLILPVEVAGYASRVAEGFRELGWEVDVLDLSGNPFDYPEQTAHDPVIAALNRLHAKAGSASPWRARLLRVSAAPLIARAAIESAPAYDAVLYVFGRTLLGRIDPWLVRRAGGRVLAVFLGSDARPAYLSGHYTNTGSTLPVAKTFFRSLLNAGRVRKMELVADAVVCHPAGGHFFTKPFVNWLAVGMPAPSRSDSTAPPPRGSTTVLLHAPSVRRQKGTEAIVRAVEGLRQRGHAVELILLSGRPNADVAASLRNSDVVLDELYSDTPLAGLASEAAAQGRAVLTFGYAQDVIGRDAEQYDIPMRHYQKPEELEAAIERVVTDVQWRDSLAVSLEEYVVGQSQPAMVATRLERLITDGTPPEWLVDPRNVDYCEGWGAPRETTRAGVRRYVSVLGPWALLLPRAGTARAALLAFKN